MQLHKKGHWVVTVSLVHFALPGAAAAVEPAEAMRLGQEAEKEGDHKAAIAYYTQAIEARPSWSDGTWSAAHFLRGAAFGQVALDSKGQDDRAFAANLRKAMEDYAAAIRYDRTNAAAFWNRALLHLANGDQEKARSDSREAHRLHPEKYPVLGE
jgi:tetratricopeptide (TPR) repeat protein